MTMFILDALALAAAAMSGQTDATPGVTAPTTVKPADEKICRRETVTGSRAKVRRICMTKAQWNEQWSRTRESNAELEARSAGRIGCVNAAASGAC